MGFKRTRNGEQRDRETAENEEEVEVENGSNETTQDQTQTEQRGAARSIHTLPDNTGNLAGYFLQPTPPARRAVVNEERMRTKTAGKQAKLSAMGIDVTPVVGPGTANEKEAQAYINKGDRTGRRARRDEATGDWMVVEAKGWMG
jgi:hypothetical protein